jgi:hypothetical protein
MRIIFTAMTFAVFGAFAGCDSQQPSTSEPADTVNKEGVVSNPPTETNQNPQTSTGGKSQLNELDGTSNQSK